jgi:hypothetical protein
MVGVYPFLFTCWALDSGGRFHLPRAVRFWGRFYLLLTVADIIISFYFCCYSCCYDITSFLIADISYRLNCCIIVALLLNCCYYHTAVMVLLLWYRCGYLIEIPPLDFQIAI